MHCTEVRFASFLSGGFTTMTVINPPEKCTSVQCPESDNIYFFIPLKFCVLVTILLLSHGFITVIVVNPPERKLAKRTSLRRREKTQKLYATHSKS